MPLTIKLGFYRIEDPFAPYRWDVDFGAGGAPDMVFSYEYHDDPVELYQHHSYTVRYWEVLFAPSVPWAQIESRNIAEIITDGATIIGTSRADRLRMTDFAERVSGDGGDDWLEGRGGDDHLRGEFGNDRLYGGAGDDRLEGGDGSDYLDGGSGADILDGGWGSDTYRIDEFDTIVENPDNSDRDTVEVAFSYAAPNAIENVRLLGLANIDATGNDDWNDLWGNEGANVLRGLDGDDHLYGEAGNDTLYGGADYDTLYGGAGDDLLYGDDHGDVLQGDEGNDVLYGGAGFDDLYGGDGGDRLIGGRGDDTLTGGAGADTFVFDHMGSRMYGDVVTDFSRPDGDRLALDRDAFNKLKKAGPLKNKFFDSGNKKADDKNDYIVYHKKQGTLYYDPDGSGRKKAYVIAEFDGNPKLKASDFDII